MVNVYKLRKYAGLLICCFLPTILYTYGIRAYGFNIGMIMFAGGSVLSVILCNVMISNPFSAMMEGAGLLVINIDSTGIIRPFITKLFPPYIKGSMGNEPVNDIYDREAVIQLAAPVKAGTAQYDGESIKITIDDEEFNRSRFGLYQFPTLIYNAQLKSLVTKDILSEQEKDSFAEHGILYLNRKMEELTNVLRDFGRYVVELTKPKTSLFQNKFFIIVLIVGVLLLLFLFARPIIDTFIGGGQSAASAIGNVVGSNAPVVPAP